MAKVPTPGIVKTRLQPFLSPNECAALAGTFLQDTVSKARSVCENVILAYSPPGKINALRKFLPAQSIYIEQTGRDLGKRMFNAFEFAFGQKSDSVVMIGTDSPTFPADFIKEAFEFLETKADAVLGKSADGGFYLLGLRKSCKEIFADVRWSSPQTFEQIFENMRRLNFQLRQIPLWYDIDEKKDFEKLRAEISADENARRYAPETYTLLKRWGKF